MVTRCSIFPAVQVTHGLPTVQLTTKEPGSAGGGRSGSTGATGWCRPYWDPIPNLELSQHEERGWRLTRTDQTPYQIMARLVQNRQTTLQNLESPNNRPIYLSFTKDPTRVTQVTNPELLENP
jgi:hypothetical protein